MGHGVKGMDSALRLSLFVRAGCGGPAARRCAWLSASVIEGKQQMQRLRLLHLLHSGWLCDLPLVWF
jgi:hypothetical protein